MTLPQQNTALARPTSFYYLMCQLDRVQYQGDRQGFVLVMSAIHNNPNAPRASAVVHAKPSCTPSPVDIGHQPKRSEEPNQRVTEPPQINAGDPATKSRWAVHHLQQFKRTDAQRSHSGNTGHHNVVAHLFARRIKRPAIRAQHHGRIHRVHEVHTGSKQDGKGEDTAGRSRRLTGSHSWERDDRDLSGGIKS